MKTGSDTDVENFYQYLWATDNGKMKIQKFSKNQSADLFLSTAILNLSDRPEYTVKVNDYSVK